MPIGFRTAWSSSRSSPGLSAASIVIAPVVVAASRNAGRQRRDSSRPVGKKNKVNTSVRNMVGYHHHKEYQTVRMAPGSEPGRVM